MTWSWLWTELNIKHLLNQCLALYFRSNRSMFWPKTDNFEISTARNLKAQILTIDLTLTWHVTAFGKFRGCFRIGLIESFRTPHRSSLCGHSFASYDVGAFNFPPPLASRGWRNTPANAGLKVSRGQSHSQVTSHEVIMRKITWKSCNTCYIDNFRRRIQW